MSADYLDRMGLLARMVCRDQMDHLDLKGSRVSQDRQVNVDCRDHAATLVRLV